MPPEECLTLPNTSHDVVNRDILLAHTLVATTGQTVQLYTDQIKLIMTILGANIGMARNPVLFAKNIRNGHDANDAKKTDTGQCNTTVTSIINIFISFSAFLYSQVTDKEAVS